MMRISFTILIFILLQYTNVDSQVKNVQYYKQLWSDTYAKALNYTRPTRNEEFGGYDLTNCKASKSYDIIIVGGGSAGTVLARRLSEIKQWRILLLEAGGEETDFSLIPGAFNIVHLSRMNWGYLTTPQKNACFGCNNNQCDFTRGRVLGGSSGVNAMLHIRGNHRDFDNWVTLGNKGWSYEEVLPYFIKSEHIDFRGDFGYHGYFGPLSATYNKPDPPFLKTVFDAWNSLGYPAIDYNGRRQIGVSRMQANTERGRRSSTNQAYLQPVLPLRKNLDVITNAFVTKIIFNGNVATGVRYLNKGQCLQASATIEVIISAGTINTPQLLKLSGIGPTDELRRFGIEPIVNLPVGMGLEDHQTIFNVPITTNYKGSPASFDQAIKDYANNGRGQLSYCGGTEVVFQPVETKIPGFPDIEIIHNIVNPYIGNEITLIDSNYNSTLMLDSLNALGNSDILLDFILLHPRSTGTVTLRSADPLDYPLIDPQYLTDERDAELLYQSITITLDNLLKTKAFIAMNATFPGIPLEPCNGLKDRDYWYCIMKYKVTGIFHPIGTCKMGNNTKTSVVNNKLQVHGVKGLRVIDASVIPTSTSGHMNSVVVMIAEKMSVEIKKSYDLLSALLPSILL